jgi:hypothetical protein
MPTLYGRAPKNSYPELLKLTNTDAGLGANLITVEDGTGVISPLSLSTTQIALNGLIWPATAPQSGQYLTLGSGSQLDWGTLTVPTNVSQLTNDAGYITSSALSTYAPIASPTFTGTVTIPAGASISGYAPLASPALTGTPTGPTAVAGTNTTQLATTAFVKSAVTAATPNLSTYAPLASPALTGVPTAPTATSGTSTTQIATTAFVENAIAGVSGGSGSGPAYTPAQVYLGSLGTTVGTLATFAAATTFQEIIVCNTGSSNATFSLYLVPSAGSASTSNAIFYQSSVSAGQSIAISSVICANSGDTLQGVASAAGFNVIASVNNAASNYRLYFGQFPTSLSTVFTVTKSVNTISSLVFTNPTASVVYVSIEYAINGSSTVYSIYNNLSISPYTTSIMDCATVLPSNSIIQAISTSSSVNLMITGY